MNRDPVREWDRRGGETGAFTLALGAGVGDRLELLVLERPRGLERPDQVHRRSRQPERVGLVEVALDQRLDFGAVLLQVRVQALHVDAGFLDRLRHLLLADPHAGDGHQGVVHLFVLALVLGGERQLRAMEGGRRENGPVLVDQADLAVGLDQLLQVRRRLLAEGAVVVEERDDGDVALGIAADGRLRIVQDRVHRDVLGQSRSGGHDESDRQCGQNGGEERLGQEEHC